MQVLKLSKKQHVCAISYNNLYVLLNSKKKTAVLLSANKNILFKFKKLMKNAFGKTLIMPK